MAPRLIVEQRRRKKYFPRVYPVQRYRPDVFQKRFRLPKETVCQLADMFDKAGFCKSTHAEGGGVGALDRVSFKCKEWLL